jgi:hypothetical protein
MTDQQDVMIYEEMLRTWPNLPSAEHEPRQFEFYMKMFKYCYPEKVQAILLPNKPQSNS